MQAVWIAVPALHIHLAYASLVSSLGIAFFFLLLHFPGNDFPLIVSIFPLEPGPLSSSSSAD